MIDWLVKTLDSYGVRFDRYSNLIPVIVVAVVLTVVDPWKPVDILEAVIVAVITFYLFTAIWDRRADIRRRGIASSSDRGGRLTPSLRPRLRAVAPALRHEPVARHRSWR